MVERRNGFFETSFLPGRHFASPADFNAQFTDWLTTANARVVRTTKARPVDLLEADQAAMLPLPPAVLHLGWRNHVRLGRDYYVRIDTNDYSVHPRAIGPGWTWPPTCRSCESDTVGSCSPSTRAAGPEA